MNRLLLLLCAASLVLASASLAADQGTDTRLEEWDDMAQTDRAVNLLLARPVGAGDLLFAVTHRARQSLTDHSGRDFLGLDAGGLKIGLGLRWGALPNLDVGVFRLNGTAEVFDTVELDLRYCMLRQEKHGIDVALRPGISWFIQPDRGDASGLFGQLIATRQIGRLTLDGGVLYHSDSSGDRKALADDDASLAFAVSAELRLSPKLAVCVETAPTLSGYGEAKPATSVAIKAFTYGHTFGIVVSNTQYIAADGVVAGSWRDWDRPILGFTVTRDIEF